MIFLHFCSSGGRLRLCVASDGGVLGNRGHSFAHDRHAPCHSLPIVRYNAIIKCKFTKKKGNDVHMLF